MSLTFKIEGLELFHSKMAKLGNSLNRDGVEPQVLKIAKEIAEDARNRAPRGPTGRLKRSLHARMLKYHEGAPMIAIAAVDRKIAPHAHFIEFGTSKMSARPFFRPAVDSHMSKAKSDLINVLKKKITGAV